MKFHHAFPYPPWNSHQQTYSFVFNQSLTNTIHICIKVSTSNRPIPLSLRPLIPSIDSKHHRLSTPFVNNFLIPKTHVNSTMHLHALHEINILYISMTRGRHLQIYPFVFNPSLTNSISLLIDASNSNIQITIRNINRSFHQTITS